MTHPCRDPHHLALRNTFTPLGSNNFFFNELGICLPAFFRFQPNTPYPIGTVEMEVQSSIAFAASGTGHGYITVKPP